MVYFSVHVVQRSSLVVRIALPLEFFFFMDACALIFIATWCCANFLRLGQADFLCLVGGTDFLCWLASSVNYDVFPLILFDFSTPLEVYQGG